MRKRYSLNLDYDAPLGNAYSEFMENLKEEKIVGNKCTTCNRIYVPVRPFCDICCEDTSKPFVVDPCAHVVAYTVYCIESLNLPKPPFAQAIIKVGYAANSFMHFLGGIEYKDAEDLNNKIKIGMKVKPVWAKNKNGDILDIQYYTPA
jgi:uncharacterized protein